MSAWDSIGRIADGAIQALALLALLAAASAVAAGWLWLVEATWA